MSDFDRVSVFPWRIASNSKGTFYSGVRHLSNWRAVIECLIRSLIVAVEGECGEPAVCTGSITYLRVVEAIDAYCQYLEPLFDQIARDVIEVTAEMALSS